MSKPTSRSRLLRNPDYVRLLSGQTISSLGSAMSTFAFTLLATTLTDSLAQVGLVASAFGLGTAITALPAGALVDRLNRKRVLVACSTAGCLSYGSVAIAGYADRLTIAHLVLVSFTSGISRAFFLPAQNAALRHIVDERAMGSAMAANEGREHVANLVGAPLGGALYSIGRVIPIGVDAVSYALMTVLLVTIRRPLPAPVADRREPILPAIRSGIVWLIQQKAIRVIALVATLLNFCVGAILIVLVINLQRQGVPAPVIGLLETGIGVGGLLGAIAAPSVIRRFTTGRIAIAAGWMIAMSFAATSMTTRPAVLVALLSLAVFTVPALNSGIFGYQVITTPDHMQGRAQSTIGFMAMSISPLAPVLGGASLDRFGMQPTVLAFSVLLTIGALALTSSRPIRTIPLLSEVGAPRPEPAGTPSAEPVPSPTGGSGQDRAPSADE
ncbi:MFS transporter [Streptomyces sp. NPDC058231]|uniref:MFS transporter n=1 Tax=Streptomyces sp. NPDC058231 TaxID=3346392 RepID=UPI0036ED9504